MARYTVVIPLTYRHGPGTKSHLSPDGGKTTLCQVENNAKGLDVLPNNWWGGPGDVTACRAAIRRWWPARELCRNCETIHESNQEKR